MVSIIEGAALTVTGSATIGNNAYGAFDMGVGTGDTATVDIKGSMTIGETSAGGAAAIEEGSLTIGDGGSGNQLLITQYGTIKIEDANGVGAQVTVDGNVVDDNTFNLGLHTGLATPTTLTVNTGTLTNNGTFGFSGNAVLKANVTNNGYFTAQNGGGTDVTMNGNFDNKSGGTFNVASLGGAAATLTQNGELTNEAGANIDVTGSNFTLKNAGGTALDNYGTASFTQDVNGPFGADLHRQDHRGRQERVDRQDDLHRCERHHQRRSRQREQPDDQP